MAVFQVQRIARGSLLQFPLGFVREQAYERTEEALKEFSSVLSLGSLLTVSENF